MTKRHLPCAGRLSAWGKLRAGFAPRSFAPFGLATLGLALGLWCALGGGLPLVFPPVSTAYAKPPAPPSTPRAIEVFAKPVSVFLPGSEDKQFGPLTFLGGLVLTSSEPAFGGLSGFVLSQEDNSFLMVTDAGAMLSGTLDLEGERPTGLSNVKITALKDDKGRLLAQRGRGDAESLTLSADAAYIGLETINEVWRFARPPMGRNGTRVQLPPDVRKLRRNQGLETLVYVPQGPLKGALIGIGEAGLKEGGDLPGFIIGGAKPGSFTIRKSGPFNATDATLAPDGTLYLLERHFSWFTGVMMQIRRFALADIRPGAVVSGEILGTFNSRYEIDNMEGISATTAPDGRTLLTLVSDNNFSVIQRTLLLRFALSAP